MMMSSLTGAEHAHSTASASPCLVSAAHIFITSISASHYTIPMSLHDLKIIRGDCLTSHSVATFCITLQCVVLSCMEVQHNIANPLNFHMIYCGSAQNVTENRMAVATFKQLEVDTGQDQ